MNLQQQLIELKNSDKLMEQFNAISLPLGFGCSIEYGRLIFGYSNKFCLINGTIFEAGLHPNLEKLVLQVLNTIFEK